MDLLYKIFEKGIIDLRKHKKLNTKIYREGEYGVKPIFEYKADKVNVNRKQYKRVIDIVKEYDEAIDELDETKESYHEERLNEFEICIDKLRNTTIKKDAMYTLIAYAFEPDNEYLRDSMLTVLYDKDESKDKSMFLGCFKKSEKSSHKSLESIDFMGFSKFAYEGRREQIVS